MATDSVAVSDRGLTAAEVAERVAKGQVNGAGDDTSRTYGQIVRANVFTRFNAILGTMLVLVLALGSPKDALFGFVLIGNALIGIFQEIRAKLTLDHLAVISAPRAVVVRDGAESEIATGDIVLDDLVVLRLGDQVPADGTVTASDNLEIDESLLTGESDPIDKAVAADVMSGSFVVAGSGRFQATKIGPDSYARKLAAEAKKFELVRSELREGINTILKYVTFALVPTAIVLVYSQFQSVGGWDKAIHHGAWREAAIGAAAGIVAMVPEGLVLLTSIAFGLAAMTLARRKVLVQELPAVEGLARVDIVCLDKTGTLTAGEIAFQRVEPIDASAADDVNRVLAMLAADQNANATARALATSFPDAPGWVITDQVAFSSARKWSAVSFADHGSWVFGAPEMTLPDRDDADPVRVDANELAKTGSRTLVLARTSAPLAGDELPANLEPVAFVLFEEQVRPDAAETLKYFAEQGVSLRVISGDNPRTVAAVARRVGLAVVDDGFDARQLPENEAELATILETNNVFGRVTPRQKRAMVHALQSKGHVVAMTGDGVNDALALKDADIGIAMGSGAAATRAVAQLVLLDSSFATLPGVVAEGRRVIANVERVSNLYVTKTMYAIWFAVVIGITQWTYPFAPRHLTIVSGLTIGIPSFFLAIAPNKRRYIPGFLRRVLWFSVPAGSIIAAAVLTMYGLARLQSDNLGQNRTVATVVLLVTALWVLLILARPLSEWRLLLVAVMAAAAFLAFAIPGLRNFYALKIPQASIVGELIIVSVAACVALELGFRASTRLRSNRRAVAEDDAT
jgi:cation-transporting ATPase E